MARGHLNQLWAYWTPRRSARPRQTDRAQLRQRLSIAVHEGDADAQQLGWVGVENIQLTGLPPSQGGLSRRPGQGPRRRWLGARHPGHQPCRPDHPRCRRAPLPGRRGAPDSRSGATASRSTGSATRRATTTPRRRGRPRRRVRRLDDRRARLGAVRTATLTGYRGSASSAAPAHPACWRRSRTPRGRTRRPTLTEARPVPSLPCSLPALDGWVCFEGRRAGAFVGCLGSGTAPERIDRRRMSADRPTYRATRRLRGGSVAPSPVPVPGRYRRHIIQK